MDDVGNVNQKMRSPKRTRAQHNEYFEESVRRNPTMQSPTSTQGSPTKYHEACDLCQEEKINNDEYEVVEEDDFERATQTVTNVDFVPERSIMKIREAQPQVRKQSSPLKTRTMKNVTTERVVNGTQTIRSSPRASGSKYSSSSSKIRGKRLSFYESEGTFSKIATPVFQGYDDESELTQAELIPSEGNK